jgi:hypothetical protein
MDRLNQVNPFAKRDSHSSGSVITYKVLTTVTWILSILVSFYYSFHGGNDVGLKHRRTVWEQNELFRSGFTQNEIITSIYWIVLFVLQLGYIGHLFSSKVELVNAACAVGIHFILNNLLHTAFVLLFVHSHFIWAEVILVLNFFNLTALYFRHNAYPRFIHTPTVSGPLAWTFVALYWNGAIMVYHPNNLVARIFANVFIWSILVYGLFFVFIYHDYTIGFSLSVLAASIGVAQFLNQIIAFQWIFSFTIMAVLFVFTLVAAVPAATGRDVPWRRSQAPPQDTERAPLLGEN